jgi:hypothetical protein
MTILALGALILCPAASDAQASHHTAGCRRVGGVVAAAGKTADRHEAVPGAEVSNARLGAGVGKVAANFLPGNEGRCRLRNLPGRKTMPHTVITRARVAALVLGLALSMAAQGK